MERGGPVEINQTEKKGAECSRQKESKEDGGTDIFMEWVRSCAWFHTAVETSLGKQRLVSKTVRASS